MSDFYRSLERRREIVRLNEEISGLNEAIVELVRIAGLNESHLFDSPAKTRRELQRRWVPSGAVVDGKEISSGG